MSHSSGRLLLIPFPCWRPHLRGPGGSFWQDNSFRSCRSTGWTWRLSPEICRFEKGIRRASSRRNRGESPPSADRTVPVPQKKVLVSPPFSQVGLHGIEPSTSALSVLAPSLPEVALTWGFVVSNRCCCPGVPHACQIGLVKCGRPPGPARVGAVATAHWRSTRSRVWVGVGRRPRGRLLVPEVVPIKAVDALTKGVVRTDQLFGSSGTYAASERSGRAPSY
jgi:hypothetical protein